MICRQVSVPAAPPISELAVSVRGWNPWIGEMEEMSGVWIECRVLASPKLEYIEGGQVRTDLLSGKLRLCSLGPHLGQSWAADNSPLLFLWKKQLFSWCGI